MALKPEANGMDYNQDKVDEIIHSAPHLQRADHTFSRAERCGYGTRDFALIEIRC